MKRTRLDKRMPAEKTTTSKLTCSQCYTYFMMEQEQKGNSKATISFYARFAKKYNNYLIEVKNRSMDEISVSILSEFDNQLSFVNWLKEQNVNIQTINAYLRGLRALGNYCLDNGYINAFKCPIKEKEPPVKQVYTEKELAALMVKPHIENFVEFRCFCAIELILNTGARCNTILNIKIEDVDLEEGYISFNTTKANKVVRLGLDRKTMKDLAEFIDFWRIGRGAAATDYLFCNEYGEQMSRDGFSKAIAIYNKSRGVEKTSIHLLRHTFAKRWITSGGDIITLAKVLTHSELEMVKRYSNLYGTDIKREMEEHSIISQMGRKSGKTLKNQKSII